MIKKMIISLIIILSYSSCQNGKKENIQNELTNTNYNQINKSVKTYDIEIVKTISHDIQAFTQGFLWRDSMFWESTGLNNQSSLRKINQESGEVLQIFNMPGEYFAEGITMLNGKIYQLTWKNELCFVYDSSNFSVIENFKYSGEGWGICNNGKELIMSDGSEYLSFRNPSDFSVIRRISVNDKGNRITRLNELEYIKGEIWANVWGENFIMCIDPSDGKLLSKININPLLNYIQLSERQEVLNGIAYDKESDKIFLTGKLWPYIFEIKLKKR